MVVNEGRVNVMSDEGARWTRSGHHSVPEKRCQPFPMIPLERWNVERECNFSGKRTMVFDDISYCPSLYSPVGTEVKTRCHRPLERSGIGGHNGDFAGTERTDNRLERVHLCVSLMLVP